MRPRTGPAIGRVLQGYFRIEQFRRMAHRAAVAQPMSSGRQAPPRPDLLPAKMRGVVGQPKPAQEVWSGAPRPDLLPGMGPAIVGGLRMVAQAWANNAVSTTPIPAGQLRVIGEGRPLATEIRRTMESFFQSDFSGVRVHVGPAAQAMGALAFTLGNELHFAPGLYDPASREGVALLGHELTHVVQQRDGRVANPYGHGVAIVQNPTLESEADRMGQRVAEEMWSGAGAGQAAMGAIRGRSALEPGRLAGFRLPKWQGEPHEIQLMLANIDGITNVVLHDYITRAVYDNHALVNAARCQLVEQGRSGTTSSVLEGWLAAEARGSTYNAALALVTRYVQTLDAKYKQGDPAIGCFAFLFNLFKDDPVTEHFVDGEKGEGGEGAEALMSVAAISGSFSPITVYDAWNRVVTNNQSNQAELRLYIQHTILHEQCHKYLGAVDNWYIESQNERGVVAYRPSTIDKPSRAGPVRSTTPSRSLETKAPLLPADASHSKDEYLNNADTLAGIVVQLGMLYNKKVAEYDRYRQRLNSNFQPSVFASLIGTMSSVVSKGLSRLGSIFG